MSHRPLSVASRSIDPAVAVRWLATIVCGSLLLGVAAHVAVPFWPVPITLQSLVVLLIGVLTGPRLAAATIVAYVAEGLAGLPVFSHGGGLVALTGPTFGYIVGYLPAAVVAGFAARRGLPRDIGTSLMVFLAADALIFAFGLAWLAASFGWTKAVAVGLTPFLVGETIKIALAIAVSQLWLGRARHSS